MLFYFQNRLKLNFNHAPTVDCNSKIKSYTLRFETRGSVMPHPLLGFLTFLLIYFSLFLLYDV